MATRLIPACESPSCYRPCDELSNRKRTNSINRSELLVRLSKDCVFSRGDLATELIHRAGLDADGLTAENIAAALQGRHDVAWGSIAFAASEVLAQVSALDLLTREDVAIGFTSAFLVRSADVLGKGDWTMETRKVLRFLASAVDVVDHDSLVAMITTLFCDHAAA